MTGNEQRMYSDITSIAESLAKIAKALENTVKVEETLAFNKSHCVTNEEADEDAKQQLTNQKFSKYDIATIEKACEQWQDESSDGPIKRAAKAYRESMELYKNLLKSPNITHIHPTIKKLKTNKDCILDYVENYFGSKGARYTDIIKFAYYLNPSNNNFTYTNANRGYYSSGFNRRIETNGWLVKGGKDYLVKGINSQNRERYFTFSKVDSHTEFWKKVEYKSQSNTYFRGHRGY